MKGFIVVHDLKDDRLCIFSVLSIKAIFYCDNCSLIVFDEFSFSDKKIDRWYVKESVQEIIQLIEVATK